MIGTRLGPYEITAKLGEGGMGVVFQAKDFHLGREVALKVLPEGFTQDPERLARFEREAKLLAQLNHPNIAQIHGLEVQDDTRALVMELVEGPTLAERLEKGALPLDESLSIVRQIAEALEEAHEKGIIHRDLKPQNIKASIEGKVKVLDFGLAKAMDPAGSSSALPADLAHSPTVTFGGTREGVILGTAAYMAPEQARGQQVDKRVDIWAFGVVVYEMLTGERLFAEESVVDTLSAVMRQPIDLAALPDTTPPSLRTLVRRCLERDPKNRLRDIGDARIVVEEVIAGDSETSLPARVAPLPRAGWRRTGSWLAAALALAALAAALWTRGASAPSAPSVAATLPPPPGTSYYLHSQNPGAAALSRDGSRLVFAAVDADSVVRLYVRELASGEQRLLAGTEGAQYPFWSADGEWIGYFTQSDQSLRKIPASGGASLRICRSLDGKGGTWSLDDVILFTPSSGEPIYRVAAAGGEPGPVTSLEDGRFNSHRHPRFLPDGRHFLFFARSKELERSAVMLAAVDGSGARELLVSESQAEYASGHLLFLREETLLAQPFDTRELALSGGPIAVAEGVISVAGASLALFSASQSDVLTLVRGDRQRQTQLELRDRSGSLLDWLATPRDGFRDMEFSPDGENIAFIGLGSPHDIYLLDLERKTETRFTFGAGEEVWATWSPDGKTLYYASNPGGPHNIFRQDVGGTGREELVVDDPATTVPVALTPDGRTLVYLRYLADLRQLWRYDLAGAEAARLFERPVFGSRAALSPDGRWISFVALEAGRPQVFVSPFPDSGRLFQVSQNGGGIPFWTAEGDEILYLDPLGAVMSVSVTAVGTTLELGAPEPLFRAVPPSWGSRNFAVSPDGQRFLVARDGSYGAANELEIVTRWTSRLESQ